MEAHHIQPLLREDQGKQMYAFVAARNSRSNDPSLVLVAKIWLPQIIIEADETEPDLVTAHIWDSYGRCLTTPTTPQKSRGIAMDHLIEQLKQKHENNLKEILIQG